jgi:hypothetical protein
MQNLSCKCESIYRRSRHFCECVSAAKDIISINIENWIIIIIIIISLQLLPRRIAMVGFCLLDHHEKRTRLTSMGSNGV